jgi:hypothetical protein
MMKSKLRSTERWGPRLVLLAFSALGSLAPIAADAQGLPVHTGSHLPLALWALGTAVLGLALIYGIATNRRRSKSEKQLTERATKDLYAREDQHAREDEPAHPSRET